MYLDNSSQSINQSINQLNCFNIDGSLSLRSKVSVTLVPTKNVATETVGLFCQGREKQLPLSRNVFELIPRGLKLTPNR